VKKTLLFLAALLTLMTALSAPTMVSAENPYCPIGVKCT
jgi:hypothetical protein